MLWSLTSSSFSYAASNTFYLQKCLVVLFPRVSIIRTTTKPACSSIKWYLLFTRGLWFWGKENKITVSYTHCHTTPIFKSKLKIIHFTAGKPKCPQTELVSINIHIYKCQLKLGLKECNKTRNTAQQEVTVSLQLTRQVCCPWTRSSAFHLSPRAHCLLLEYQDSFVPLEHLHGNLKHSAEFCPLFPAKGTALRQLSYLKCDVIHLALLTLVAQS